MNKIDEIRRKKMVSNLANNFPNSPFNYIFICQGKITSMSPLYATLQVPKITHFLCQPKFSKNQILLPSFFQCNIYSAQKQQKEGSFHMLLYKSLPAFLRFSSLQNEAGISG